jgi:RNA polymerase sigma-70 factor (ECF subfamily)
MDFDEAAQIDRSRRGDLNSFNRLVEHYQRPVYNLCLRMLGSPQAAEDATQEAFISAYRSLDKFRGGSFRSWLFRIASNACYDDLRRRRSRPALSLDAPIGDDERSMDLPDRGASLDDRAERTELAQTLQTALSRLPPDQRLAIILSDVQGFAYEEIAQATGASLGTVKSRISRGRSRLRKLLLATGELLPARFRQSSEGI